MIFNEWMYFALVFGTFVFHVGAMDPERYKKEIEAMPRNLSVFDDNRNPVPITMEEEPDTRNGKFFFGPITFDLYTRDDPTNSERLEINDRSKLLNSKFDSKKSTRFVTHGWMDSSLSRSCQLIRDAYLKAEDYNVIVIDWSGISQSPYIWASNRVEMVGKEVAQMIDFMVKVGDLNTSDTVLVGHSLGAHVMGIAGYHSNYIIREVVGLDPALPMFYFAKPHQSISKESAEHVQIIHTDAGVLGYLSPAGHTDFYPNGGRNQPGCCDSSIPLICMACSHWRAFEFFAESIISPFIGVRCTDYENYTKGYCRARAFETPMGGPGKRLPHPGMYFMATGSKSPFSKVR